MTAYSIGINPLIQPVHVQDRLILQIYVQDGRFSFTHNTYHVRIHVMLPRV